MRSLVFSTVLICGFVSVGSALAQSTAVPPALPGNTTYPREYSPTDPPSAPAGDDTIVCNYQNETGSHLVTRVCRTLRAWKLMQADAHEFMEYGFRGSHQVDGTSDHGGGG